MSYKVINSRLNLFDLLTLHLGNQTQEEDHIQNNVTMKEGVILRLLNGLPCEQP